jgi:hypothetical protein
MDLRWGFNNVRIREGDEKKVAFITPLRLLEPTVIQFGLCNAPSTFQCMMDVTASVTEEIRRKEKEKEATIQTNLGSSDLARIELSAKKPNWSGSIEVPSQEQMTHGVTEKRDSGTMPVSHGDRATLTGKLYKHVMVLIKWQCGADEAVDARMVRALEGWLRNRGISIYTDLL